MSTFLLNTQASGAQSLALRMCAAHSACQLENNLSIYPQVSGAESLSPRKSRHAGLFNDRTQNVHPWLSFLPLDTHSPYGKVDMFNQRLERLCRAIPVNLDRFCFSNLTSCFFSFAPKSDLRPFKQQRFENRGTD